MSEVEKEMVESKTETDSFSFRPIETTDKKRIAEILDSLFSFKTGYTILKGWNAKRGDALTTLGVEVVKILAIKVVEFPFLRVFHSYKYQKEERKIEELFFPTRNPPYYPSPDSDAARARYKKDIWNDEKFFALFDNEHNEVASTCKIVKCPKCSGTGKMYENRKYEEDEWETCPNCGGEGTVGIRVCGRCDGNGRVKNTYIHTRKVECTCDKCKGEKELVSVLVAKLITDGGSASSRSKKDEKIKAKAGRVAIKEEKWCEILEHEPKLHYGRKLNFEWKRLKEEKKKIGGRIKKIRTIKAEGGVIDPKKNNLSKLPLSKDDIKRVYDTCYSKKSGIFMQNQAEHSNVHVKCFDEEVTIVTGVGMVKIFLPKGKALWLDMLGETQYLFDDESDLFSFENYDAKKRYQLKDYPQYVQDAIKEANSRGVSTPKLSKYAISSTSLKKTKDAAQGCGCLLAIIAAGAFGIWWWIEGFSMAAITDLWKSANKDGSLGTGIMVLGGLITSFIGWKRFGKGDSGESTSPKKRWKFITLGVLLGFFGAHLAYAKRWVLFLLLWGGLIAGNVMSGDSKEQIANPEEQESVQAVDQVEPNQSQQNTDAGKDQSSPIGNIGFAVWGLLWIGGTLFIKKDGNGCRM